METELAGRVEELRRIVEEFFLVEHVWYDGGRPAFAVRPGPDSRQRFLRLRARLEPMDYLPLLRRRNGAEVVVLIPRPARGQWRWQVNLALFLATIVTTFLAGYFLAEGQAGAGLIGSPIGGALAFSLPLMAILLTHEMGHKIVSIVRKIDASLPYFIPMLFPAPVFQPGTMGAVIVTRTPAPNRDALMDLGASGPIAGFLVAIPVLIIGVLKSTVLTTPLPPGGELPEPLLVQLLIRWLLHPPENAVVIGHPAIFAGWFGLLVTSINLLPGSMLDGGHAVRALFGGRIHMILSWVAVVLAVFLGYWPMALLILLMLRRGHPGPLDDISPLSLSRIAVGVVLLAIFILSAVRFPLPGF